MRTVRRWSRWFALLPLLLAAACGPGVGGTGTGEGFALDFFGAKAASVCTASFAEELKCPSRIVIGPAKVDLSKGSDPVLLVDDPANARILARVDDSAMDFEVPCEGVRFTGVWGTTADGEGRFFGHFTTPGMSAASPGSIAAPFDGTTLSYVLTDARGDVVVGPVAVRRADGEVTETVCSQLVASTLLSAKYR